MINSYQSNQRTKTIHISEYECLNHSKDNGSSSQKQTFILGKNLQKYLKKYFNEKYGINQERRVAYMQKVIFKIIQMLRNQNFKNYYEVQLKNYNSSQDKIEQLCNTTSLKFNWLYPLAFKETLVSTILMVENTFSKQRVYVVDGKEYQQVKQKWISSISQSSRCFENYVVLYDQNRLEIEVDNLSYHISFFQQSSLKLISKIQKTFQIPAYQRSYFQQQFLKPLISNQQLLNATNDEKMLFGKKIDNDFKLFFLTRRPMSSSLSRYLDSITIVVNDMIKFVGYDSELRFEANNQTNQVELCIRNKQRIAYQDIKTATDMQFQYSDQQKSIRYLYSTKADQENVIIFLNYCEQSHVLVTSEQNWDEQSRFKLFQTINIATQQLIKESKIKLANMDAAQFKKCPMFHYQKVRKFNSFQVITQSIDEFVKKCVANKDSDERKYLKYFQDYLSKFPNGLFKINSIIAGFSIKKVYEVTNYRQLMIASEMIKRPSKSNPLQVNSTKKEINKEKNQIIQTNQKYFE